MATPAASAAKPPARKAGNPARSGPAPLNPERLPQLLGKYSKLLGKDIENINITYTASGVTVTIDGMGDYKSLKKATLAEFKAKKRSAGEADDEDKLRAFRNKYELRLNEECPRIEVGDDEDVDEKIRSFMDGLDFRKRRALMMTQKQFTSAYPNGFPQE